MDLHQRLRTLAAELGSEVFVDADSLRGALDDYMDEGSATAGEINLLVDAVRLDALRRLLMMIEHGAEVSAAVSAAGEQLARDRGSDDVARCCWACAALAYALGQVGEIEVLRYESKTPPQPDMPRPAAAVPLVPPLSPPHDSARLEAPLPAAPPPATPSQAPPQSDAPAAAPSTPVAYDNQAAASDPSGAAAPSDAPTQPLALGPHGVPARGVLPRGAPPIQDVHEPDMQFSGVQQPVGVQSSYGAAGAAAPPAEDSDGGWLFAPASGVAEGQVGGQIAEPLPQPFQAPEPSRRRTGLLVGLATAVLVAATVVAAVLLTSGDGQPEEAGGQDPTQSPTQATPTQPTDSATATPPEGTTIPEENMLVALTNKAGNSRIMSVNVRTGARERLTSGPADVLPAISPDRTTVSYLKRNAADQFTPYLLDVATGEERPLESPCTFSTRPAWNPSGDQLALVCLEDGVATGMYIVDLDGNQIARVPTPGTPDGAPTWTSDDQLVYTQLGADANSPSTLWSINADGSSATPLTDGSTGWDHHPDWSEEAGLLLFSRTDGDVEYGNLGALDADLNPVAGGVSQDLEVAHPVWSPDGTEVAFTMLDDTRSPRLWVGPVDSSGEPTMVPGVEGAPGPPVWASR